MSTLDDNALAAASSATSLRELSFIDIRDAGFVSVSLVTELPALRKIMCGRLGEREFATCDPLDLLWLAV